MVSGPGRPGPREALTLPGFTPCASDLEALFDLLADPARDVARRAERALARLGATAGAAARERFAAASPPVRGRLCRLVGRLAHEERDESLVRFLLERLRDSDPKTRRNAVIALGKISGPGVEQALIAVWRDEPALELRRSVASALGKVGGPVALALLARVDSDDAELRRIVAEARLKLERTLHREEASRIDPQRSAPLALPVVFHCRAGVEALLAEEIDPALRPRRAGVGRVRATLVGPLDQLLRPRIALRFCFPLPAEPVRPGEDHVPALVRALSGRRALGVLRAFTDGRIRFRLEWKGAGHRRAATFRCATEIARAAPDLVNDPTRSLWEAGVSAREGRVEVELWPRGIEDTRFAYRHREVPAASHPTLAAALARLAGTRPDDVVWDPFVGSGTELVERALLGSFRLLLGSDVDPGALEAAAENLAAAGVEGAELALGDARGLVPAVRPTLILTNPPMGRRVRTEVAPLLEAFLDHAAQLLAPGGRWVWISPLGAVTRDLATRQGLVPTFHRAVDMGGFHAEIQVFVRPEP